MALPNHRSIVPLTEYNYLSWADECRALLSEHQAWFIVSGEDLMPDTALEPKEYREWRNKRAEAAGIIFLSISPSQRVHITAIQDDPVAMWAKLRSVFIQQVPGA